MKYLLLIAALLPCAANAARFDISAKLEFIIAHNPAVFATTDGDWLTLRGVTSAGVCGTANSPYGQTRVVFRIRADMERVFDLAMLARGNNLDVMLSVDDTITDASGFCFIRWLSPKPVYSGAAKEQVLPEITQVE